MWQKYEEQKGKRAVHMVYVLEKILFSLNSF